MINLLYLQAGVMFWNSCGFRYGRFGWLERQRRLRKRRYPGWMRVC